MIFGQTHFKNYMKAITAFKKGILYAEEKEDFSVKTDVEAL